MNFKHQKGLSVIEVILAAGIFIIFATGISQAVVGGLNSNRLGEEQTVASQFASEGIEAARSIRNQAFTNLVNTSNTGVVASSSGVWKFSGTNNQYGPGNKYTRVLTVSDVQRDGSGNIVSGGGTLDSDTKKVTSTVSWNFTSSRANSVVLTTYFTNWKSILSVSTCNNYAIQQGYSSGTCRQNASQCSNNSEINLSAGDTYCPHSGNQNVCCATAGQTFSSCAQYCQAVIGQSYSTGDCLQNSGKCAGNGETYQSGGDVFCTHTRKQNVCCCK